jgi:hypothetical protein
MPPIGAFGRRFPDVQDVIFEWGVSSAGRGTSPGGMDVFPHSMRAADGTFEAVLGCPNPRCRGGGFEVEFLVESMISERLKEKIGLLVCIGWERQQGSRTERTPCMAAIRYRVRLCYREPVVQATPKEMNGKGEPF